MKMKKLHLLLTVILVVQMMLPLSARAADFHPSPKTPYAQSFLTSCEGQTWFINEVERLLNFEQKTLDTITSSDDLNGIKSLGLRDHHIMGSIPAAIGELKELRYLFLSGNQLSGTIPASLYALPKLQNVDLSNNNYSGAIPVEFGVMPALIHLSLRGNQYMGSVPASILANSAIQYLDLSSNDLSGAIPAALNQMTALQYLAVSDNNWTTGELPDLSALTNLKTLSAWNCNLTGTIPESLYTLTTLQVLDLDSNNLSGEISTSIAGLVHLQQLSIANNQIRGTVPDALGTLPKLATLDISNNKLRGKLPASVAAYSAAYAQNNYMTGDILKGLANNAGNFTDGASTEQYQLTATKTQVQISKDGVVNLYALLQNKSLTTGSTSKVILNPEEYTVTCDAAKVEITSDTNGFYVKALTDIPISEKLAITIQIKDNTGSDYSTVELTLTTDTVPSGGGGAPSGGGTPGGSETTPVHHDLYINGYPDSSFHAGDNITREQTAVMLIRALKIDTSTSFMPTYPDVASDRWSFAMVETATREQYLKGYGDGTFGPAKPITRAEMATVLSRIAAKQGSTMNGSTKTFSDVADGQWYSDYIRQAVQYGLINGYTDGTFRPTQNITRAEAVVMINRLLGRNYKTAAELQTMNCPFPDVSVDYWAYGDILEAAITHNH